MNGDLSDASTDSPARHRHVARLRRAHLWVTCLAMGLAVVIGVAGAWQLLLGVVAMLKADDVAGAVGMTLVASVLLAIAGLLWAARVWVDAATDAMIWVARREESVGTAIPLDDEPDSGQEQTDGEDDAGSVTDARR